MVCLLKFSAQLPKVFVSSTWWLVPPSLVPTPRATPGDKRSGEQSRISWAFSPKRWKTNEIVRSLIINTPLQHSNFFISIRVSVLFFWSGFPSIRAFFERVFHKIFWTLLGYTVAKAPATPRNSTWFTRPFLLVRGWGLGTRLGPSCHQLPNFDLRESLFYLKELYDLRIV